MATTKKFLKGFANLGIFPDITDEVESYKATGENKITFDGAVSCSVTDNKSTTNISGDDDPAWYVETLWTDTDLEIAVRGMELSTLAKMLGIELSEDSTLEESINLSNTRFGLTFSALRSDLGYRLYRYYSCSLTGYSVSHQTRADSTEAQDYTLQIKASPRKIDGAVRATKDVAKGDSLNWLDTLPTLPESDGP